MALTCEHGYLRAPRSTQVYYESDGATRASFRLLDHSAIHLSPPHHFYHAPTSRSESKEQIIPKKNEGLKTK